MQTVRGTNGEPRSAPLTSPDVTVPYDHPVRLSEQAPSVNGSPGVVTESGRTIDSTFRLRLWATDPAQSASSRLLAERTLRRALTSKDHRACR